MRAPGVDQLAAMTSLLYECGLPADDLMEQDLSFFLVEGSGAKVHAMGGLEILGDTALIRSIATTTSLRRKGIAQSIVGELESIATRAGINELYLLTESAQGYFETLNYTRLDRDKVPQSIRESRQFSSLCPDSAVVMSKQLVLCTSPYR